MQSSTLKGATNSIASGSRNAQQQKTEMKQNVATINNSVDFQNNMMTISNSMNNTGSV
jgi:hypothetical protein